MSEVSVEQIQQEAAHMAGMLASPGWAVIKDEVSRRMNGDGKHGGLVKALISEDDPQRIRDLQANIRSLEFLLKFPDEILEAARRATEQAPREDEP